MKFFESLQRNLIQYQFHIRVSLYHILLLGLALFFVQYSNILLDDLSSFILFIFASVIFISWVDTIRKYHQPLNKLNHYIKDFLENYNPPEKTSVFYPDMLGELSYLVKIIQADLLSEKEKNVNLTKQVQILGSSLDKLHSKLIIVDKQFKIKYINQATLDFFKRFQDNFSRFQEKPELLNSPSEFGGEDICSYFEQICHEMKKINNLDYQRSLHIDAWIRDFKGLLITNNIYNEHKQRIATVFEIHDLTALHQARGSLEQLLTILHQDKCMSCSNADIEKLERLVLSPDFFAITQKIQNVIEIMKKNNL